MSVQGPSLSSPTLDPKPNARSQAGLFSSLGTRVHTIWNQCPKAIKLPLGIIGTLSIQQPVLKGFFGLTTGYLETPEGTLASFTGRPIKILGSRQNLFQLLGIKNDPLPFDPKIPLTELDQKIGAFERAKLKISDRLPIATPLANAPSFVSQTAQKTSRIELITNKNLNILIEKISYFSILQALHAVSGIEESDSAPSILHIVDAASRKDKNPLSIWQLFTAHYQKKLTVFGWIKAGITYLLLWKWTSILPKTVDGYLKNILSEMRIHLKENGEKRKQFVNGLVEDLDNFLDIYNGASETYAFDTERKGNLNRYRKSAIDLHLPTADPSDAQKTPDEIHLDFCRKLSNSIVDHFSPTIPFQFAQDFLNNTIRTQLKNTILPGVFLSVSFGGKESNHHNIPFFLALTKTLTQQINHLQESLEQNQSDPDHSSIAGIKNFEGIVKKLMRALDLADYKTPEELKEGIRQLEQRKETDFDAIVRNGIEQGMQKGMAVLFDYLSKQENTEALFAILFESLIDPLSGKVPMNDEQWKTIETEYRAATIRLKQSASSLFNQIVKEAVEDKVRGGSIPELGERAANDIFNAHKLHGITTFKELTAQSSRMCEKIEQPGSMSGTIYPELNAIVTLLKAFENEERVNIAMNQDPPPRIAQLPMADMESVLRSLHPLYEGSNELMDLCNTLQTLQQSQTHFEKSFSILNTIDQILVELLQKDPPLRKLGIRLNQVIKSLEAHPELVRETKKLKDQLKAVSELFEELKKEHDALLAINTLKPPGNHSTSVKNKQDNLIVQLALFAHGRPPRNFQKSICLKELRSLVLRATSSKEEQNQLLRLINDISRYNTLPQPRPNFINTIWMPLMGLLDQHNIFRRQNCLHIKNILNRNIPNIQQFTNRHKSHYDQLKKANQKEIKKQASQLKKNSASLEQYIESAQREYQTHLSSADAGVAGFALGALSVSAGSAIGARLEIEDGEHFGAAVGGFLGAGAAYFVRRLDKLAINKALRGLSIESIIAGGVGGAAAWFASKNAPSPLTPVLVGASAASAGFEYAAAKFNERAINAGVQLVLPKVESIFDKSYEHLLTNDLVIDSGMKIAMKQVIKTFPPKGQ